MESEQNLQYVTFTLGRDQYGLPVSQAREILDLVPVTKIPRVPAEMLGVINLRGQVVPIVDMQRKLDLVAPDEEASRCIIVVEIRIDAELLTIGLLVEEVREVIDLPDNLIEPAPRLGTRLKTDFIRGMGKSGETFIVLLDMDRIFNAAELEQYQASGAPADARPQTVVEA